jgi:hypothetical protein
MARVPDVVGEVLGYRSWCLRTSHLHPPELVSINGQLRWPHDNWAVATCPHGHEDDEVPAEGCTCGIYAALSKPQLDEDWGYNRSLLGTMVLGEVGLVGKIIPGTKAFRAQKARPLHLWVSYADWKLAHCLAEAYRVPVDLTNLLEPTR